MIFRIRIPNATWHFTSAKQSVNPILPAMMRHTGACGYRLTSWENRRGA